MAKSFFIDTSRCTACRGCQVACKQWNQNPASETKNWGSHQNPRDLEWNTFKLVRMEEQILDGQLKWLFFPDQCRHCVVPPCKLAADLTDEQAIVVDQATGAVLFTERTKNVPFEDVRTACPYDVPRQDPKTKVLKKCTMCFDRITNGLKPACVHHCPTGALNFGEREDMLKQAKERLEAYKKTRPKTVLSDANDVNCVFLTEYDPKAYHRYAVAERDASPASRRELFARLFSPAARIVG